MSKKSLKSLADTVRGYTPCLVNFIYFTALSLKCYQCVAENEKDQCATNATAVTSIDCKDAIIPPGLPRDKMVCVTRMEADISGETNTFKALQRMCSVDPAALAQGGVSGTCKYLCNLVICFVFCC